MLQTVKPKLHEFPLTEEMKEFNYLEEGKMAREQLDGTFAAPEVVRSEVLSSDLNHVYVYRADQFPGKNFKSVTAANAVKRAHEASGKLPKFALATAGSYGIGVGIAAKDLGAAVTAFVPNGTNHHKVELMRELGMTVVEVPGVFDDALERSQAFAQEHDVVHLHPFANPANIAATAAIGIDMHSRVSGITHFIGQVGGASFFTGVAGALKQLDRQVETFAVQIERVDPFVQSVRSGTEQIAKEHRPELISKLGGVGVRSTDPMTLGAGSRVVDYCATVEYREVLAAMVDLRDELGVMPEFAGVVGAAKARRLAKFGELSGATILCAVTGANPDDYPTEQLEKTHHNYRKQEEYETRNLSLLR